MTHDPTTDGWNEDHTAIVYFDDTPFDFLSNFHPSPFKWTSTLGHIPGETTVATGEHAFQAEKATRRSDYVKIITASSPGLAKRLGRQVNPLRDEWDDIKFQIMRDVIRAKFSLGSEMARQLLETGDVALEEGNHWHDNVWGNCICGGNRCRGRGQNLLGVALMGQRNELHLRHGA